MSSRLLTALVCVTFTACAGKAVDMGGALDGGADVAVGGQGGTSGADAEPGDAEAGAADAADVPAPGCTLPGREPGEALIRIGNLVTSPQTFDFCIDQQKALFASAGADCPQGLPYRRMTVPFRAPAGNVMVKVIPYGGSCDESGLTSAELYLKADQTTSVLVIGDGMSAPILMSGAESSGGSPAAFKLRFLHAAPGLPALDFGLVKEASPPGELYVAFGRGYVFGSAKPKSSDSTVFVDANGYVEPQMPGGTFPLGIAHYSPGQTAPVQSTYAAKFNLHTGSSYTVFMIGMGAQDPAYPYQLWACQEYPIAVDHTLPQVFALCSDSPEWN